jgi:hypothetical protein
LAKGYAKAKKRPADLSHFGRIKWQKLRLLLRVKEIIFNVPNALYVIRLYTYYLQLITFYLKKPPLGRLFGDFRHFWLISITAQLWS